MTNNEGALFLLGAMTLLVAACALLAWWRDRK